jgi:tRNA A-37 threonylcarbamoyl transferase component Bud32
MGPTVEKWRAACQASSLVVDCSAPVRCPTCKSDYPDGTEVCPRDGRALAPDREPLVNRARETTGLASPEAAPSTTSAATFADSDPGAEAAFGPQPVSDTQFDSLIGIVLAGRYEVLRRIGEGGMGAVYEAKHTVIGKRVAVKVLLEKFHAKSDFVARLLQEARLASSIGHENIVDVTDFGTTDDGRSFVVMEFLDGESLADLARREAPLPIERSLRVARQAASALGAAHAKGIFHRDVKPENIYLIRRGEADFVKVVDFGISKAVKPGGVDDGNGESYRLTHTGLLLGTPLYMSPEQARGDEDLDHRVDIWALGVLLYECLTGEVPFRANNYLQIISQVLTHEPLPPSRLRPELGIPDAVEAVVMRAMEKDRARRYQTMAEVERDLERLLAGDQNVGLPDTDSAASAILRRPPRRWPLGVAALLVLAGGVTLALAHPGEGPRAQAPAPPPSTVATQAPAQIGANVPPTAGRAALPPAAPPVRKLRVAHGERRIAKPVSPPANLETSESVKRGMLPSGSREAYPEK